MMTEIGSVARQRIGDEHLPGEAAEDEGHRQLRAEHHLRGDEHRRGCGARGGREGGALAIRHPPSLAPPRRRAKPSWSGLGPGERPEARPASS